MENIPVLCRKLFLDDPSISKYLPRNIYNWAVKIIDGCYRQTSNPGPRKRIIEKTRHTKYVLLAGLEIMEKSSEINWNKYQGIISCFLHDIGRFPQSYYDTYSDEDSCLDHAKMGADMFLKTNLKIKKYDYDRKEIYEAIEKHSRKTYLGNNIYAKLVRDADKIGLFRELDRLEAWGKEEFKRKTISPKALEEFIYGKSVSHSGRKTLADHYLLLASWFYDLNFAISKKILIDEKIPEIILDRLKKLKIRKSEYEKIERVLKVFKETNQ